MIVEQRPALVLLTRADAGSQTERPTVVPRKYIAILSLASVSHLCYIDFNDGGSP